MSGTETLIVVGVFVWALWLIWHGRESSPRRRREQARWDYLLAEAIREKRDNDESPREPSEQA